MQSSVQTTGAGTQAWTACCPDWLPPNAVKVTERHAQTAGIGDCE